MFARVATIALIVPALVSAAAVTRTEAAAVVATHTEAAAVVAATTLAANTHGSAPSNSQCNVGSIQCCTQLASSIIVDPI